jgi:hypothetical protein
VVLKKLDEGWKMIGYCVPLHRRIGIPDGRRDTPSEVDEKRDAPEKSHKGHYEVYGSHWRYSRLGLGMRGIPLKTP